MEIHILLAGVEFGPYTDDQARQLVADGLLDASDPAKRLSETEWLPLSEVLENPQAEPAAEAPAEEELPTEEPFAGEAFSSEEPPLSPPIEDAPHIEPEEEPESFFPHHTELPDEKEEKLIAPEQEILPPQEEPLEEEPVEEEAIEESQAEETEKPAPEPPVIAPPKIFIPTPVAAPTPAAPSPVVTAAAAPPMINISMPSRAKAKGALRTGSLLAKEALHAARAHAGVLRQPTAPVAPAPVKEEAPRPRNRIILQDSAEAMEAPPAKPAPRKPIRLTQSITLPPSAFTPEPIKVLPKKTQTSSLEVSTKSGKILIGQITRPAFTKDELVSPAPETKVGKKADEEKAIEPKAAQPPPLPVPEKPAESAKAETPDLPPAPPSSEAEKPFTTLLPTPGLTSSGDLSEKRSLKITGALKQSTTHNPVRLTTSLPYKPGESSRLPSPIDEPRTVHLPSTMPLPESKVSPPEIPLPELKVPPPLIIPPALPQPHLEPPKETRGDTGKIPVSEMPPEGLKIRSPRRLTSKIPIPDEPSKVSSPLPEISQPVEETLAEKWAKVVPSLPETSKPVEEPSDKKSPALTPSIPEASKPAEKTSSVTPPLPETSKPIEEISAEKPSKITLPPATTPKPIEETSAAKPPETVAAADSTEIAKPEKVRLRRPVKLELTSKAKVPQDSGRLTLEAFSKMASLAIPSKIVNLSELPTESKVESVALSPTPAVSAKETETSVSTPAIETPTAPAASIVEPAAKISPAPQKEEFTAPRLAETPAPDPISFARVKVKRKQKWLWLVYLIIVLGFAASIFIIYLVSKRQAATPSSSIIKPKGAANVAVVTPPVKPAQPASLTPPAPTPAPKAGVVTPPPPDVSLQVNAYIADGKDKFLKNDFDGAITAYNHALDLDPKSANALYNRGLVKDTQQNMDGALADYSQAIQADPKMSLAYYSRGLARHSHSDLDGAISDYNMTVQIDPKNALAYFNRGLIRMQRDDIDGAIVDSSRALELDPRLIQAYYNRGLGRMAQGAMDAALNDMKTFCQLAPQASQDTYADYARLYIWLIRTQQNQMAEANHELDKAMNSGWNGAADAMVTKIGEYLLGQISEEDLIKSATSPIPVKDQGQHCEVWYFIGMRHLNSGDKETAAQDLRKCVQTQKTDYCEYILAQEALKSLGAAGTAGVTTVAAPAPVANPAPAEKK